MRLGEPHTTIRTSETVERFDLWYEVPLVPQLTGMSCWAAAAAMIVGWRDCIPVEANAVATGAGRWAEYREGLEPRDVPALARAFELEIEPPQLYGVDTLRALLERYGPLWVGNASPGLHVFVIAGLHGGGGLDDTRARIADPWPVGVGERYELTARALLGAIAGVADQAGVPASVLHARSARLRAGRRWSVRSSASSTTFGGPAPAADRSRPCPIRHAVHARSARADASEKDAPAWHSARTGGTRMRNFVLDPAHGGTAPSGKSTPGLAEKALTLDVAERTREALSGYGAVYLTRERDVNPTIAARAALSRMREAEAFVSIHVAVPGSSAYGGGTWVHSGAGRESEELATRLSQALARTGGEVGQPVRRAELAVLDPASLSPRTAACLLELAPTATSGGRLEDDAYRSRVAEAIASAMAQTSGYGRRGEAAGLPARGANASASFDVRHEVQLVPQQTSMSCWAAAASMVVGWRDRVSIDPSDVARGAGHWAAYAAGLNPVDVPALARAWNLTMEQPQGYTIEALRQLLAEAGPLWIGEAVPSLHAIALSGMWGDGTPGGTTVRIHDPWPVGRGATYEQPFQAFLAGYEAAAQFPHVQIQVLHSGRGATARAASFGRGRSAPAAYGGTLSGHGTHERYRSHHGAYGSAAVAEARGAASMPNLNFGPIEGGRPIGAPSTPSAVTVGTPVQIMWADFNDSDVAAGPYEDTVTVRDRDNREVYRTQVQAEAGLDPQRNEVRYVVFTPAQPGTYIGRVQLNSGPHPIPESQIDDNVAETLPFTVAPGKAVEVPATSRAAAAEPQAMFVFSQVGLLVSPDDTDNPDKHVILHHDAGNMVSFAIKNMGDGPGVCEVGLEVDGRYVKSWRSSRLQPGQSESPPYVRGLGRFPEGRHEFLAYLNPGAGVSDHISNLVDIA